MTQLVNGLIILLGSSLAASIVAKATVITTLGLMGAWLARRSRAAVRHTVLAASFAVLLALPIASILITPVRITIPTAAQDWRSPYFFSDSIDSGQFAAPGSPSAVVRSRTTRWPALSPLVLLFVGWFAGATFFLLRMIVGLRQVHSMRRFGLPWRQGQSIVERLVVDVGIVRHVEVLLHESLPAPVTCGVVNPAIVLPPDAQNWDGEDLNRAIMHELEHIRRWDWMSHCLARAVCAAYWFHPFVWVASRQLALEAERSCDDAVLRRSEATAYADQLVELAQRLSTAKKAPALAMANRSDLSSRVNAVLDSRQQRGRAGTILVALSCAASAIVVVTLSPLRMVAAPQSTSAQSAGSAPTFEVASPSSRFEVASIKPGCGGDAGGPQVNDAGAKQTKTGRGGGTVSSPGRLSQCGPLENLILSAYVWYAGGRFHGRSPGPPIEGGPAWIHSDFYQIEAKAEGTTSREIMNGPMMQALLEDRFKLKVRHESREVPVYALTVAKSGIKLQPFQEGSCVRFPQLQAGEVPPVLKPGQMPCMNVVGLRNGPNMGLKAQGDSLGEFAKLLTLALDRPVIDTTGIKGTFDIHLEFAIDDSTPKFLPGADPNMQPAPLSADPVGPSIFTAVQAQLGLKLEPTKGPGEFIVVEHVERPSAN